MEPEHLRQPASDDDHAGTSENDNTTSERMMEPSPADEACVPASEPPLEVARGAVIRAARTRSARVVAKEARVNVEVVESFIRGSSPDSTTLQRLRAWHGVHAGGSGWGLPGAMPWREIAPSVEVLRDAAKCAATARSTRAVAREIGLTPPALGRFTAGVTRPHPSTVRLLRRWYVRGGTDADVSPEIPRAALRVLLDGLPERLKLLASARMADAVLGVVSEEGVEPPGWTQELKSN
ncbi:MAG TPA: hypothetical protein VFJ82_17215 [Longimicrobium sp.]|nr:hypothetical protein [Longimicrobium sp.]